MSADQNDDASFFTAIQRQQQGQKLYCGDKPLLPQGYSDFGSRRICLRKGVGVGLAISRQRGPTATNKYKNTIRPWYYGIPWWVWLSLFCLLILLILVLVLVFRKKE